MRRAWLLVAAGAVLVVGPWVAVHLPLVVAAPGQRIGLAVMGGLCRGALGQIVRAGSAKAQRQCVEVAWALRAAGVLEVVGAGAVLLGGWRLWGRHVMGGG